MEEISLVINGKAVVCNTGTSILDAASKNGIRIPTLCHHHHLESVGACRLCVVEEEDSGRVFASCVTPAAPNMSILTDTPALRDHRKTIIRLMMANHPESCILCNQGNRCELREIAAELGVGSIGLYPIPHYTGFEAANPFIIRDLSKCILCGRCIRADHDLVMVGAIDYNRRGFKSRPATVHEKPLEESNCTFCGTCVSLCPTGALITKNIHHVGSPQREKKTICSFCGVGCSLIMGVKDNKIVEVNPSHEGNSLNCSTLCVRGHFAHDYLNSSRRLTQPLMRKDNELIPVDWKEAVRTVAERLLSIKKKDGPQSLGLFGSSKCSVEENYLFQKLGRILLGTNNLDNGGTLTGQSVMNRFYRGLDNGGRVKRFDELEKSDIIFIIGADPSHSLPVLSYYIKWASKIKDIPVIIADPRKTELVPFSSMWLSLENSSDPYLINGLAAILYKSKAIDSEFIKQYTTASEHYLQELSSYDIDQVPSKTGISREQIDQCAEMMVGKRIAFVVGHGILQQKLGNHTMDALLRLALLTGSMGKIGTGFYFLVSENNVMGAGDMGMARDLLPGRNPLLDPLTRKHWERAWDIRISPDPGLDIIRMVEEAVEGNIKALYIMGENPIRSLPQPGQVQEAFKNLEFLVVQDILEHETTLMADILLPGAAFSEKSGAFTNLEGRIQCFDPVVLPPGNAKSDWEILSKIGHELGHPSTYESIQKLRKEISNLVPMYSGLINASSESWVREKSCFAAFNPEDKGEKIPFPPMSQVDHETADMEYPITAMIGGVRYHLGNGTRTCSSERIGSLDLEKVVNVPIGDGDHLGIDEGDTVRISSLYGNIERKVNLVKGLRSGTIFISKAIDGNNVLNLFPLVTPETEQFPGLKDIRVKIDKIHDHSINTKGR